VVSIGLGFKLIGSKQMLFQTIQSSVIAGAQSILEAEEAILADDW